MKFDPKSSKTILFCARKITYFQARGIFRDLSPPTGNFGGSPDTPWLGGDGHPHPGGVKGLRFRGRNFWQKWSKIKNSGPQILSAATGFVILILEVKNKQKRGVFSKSRVLFLFVKINSLLLETAVVKLKSLGFRRWKIGENSRKIVSKFRF